MSRKLEVDDGRAPFFSCFSPPPCSSRRQHNLGTRKGLIGNPVEVGSGPAAVTPPFSSSLEKGNSFGLSESLFRSIGMGRPPKERGSQKTCPGASRVQATRTWLGSTILKDQVNWVQSLSWRQLKDFFLAPTSTSIFPEGAHRGQTVGVFGIIWKRREDEKRIDRLSNRQQYSTNDL